MSKTVDLECATRTAVTSSPSDYHMHRYLWRSILTLLGPPSVLAFYIYICVHFLTSPPVNGTVISSTVNGNWVFYAWFVVSILMLDWARTGLANIEAYALMRPSLAPHNVTGLMWHIDSNWANPLWWLRGIWSWLIHVTKMKSREQLEISPSFPRKLWILLAIAMFFLFAAVPLCGLAIQTDQVLVRSSDLAPLYGPNESTFGLLDLGYRIRTQWQSGRRTSPQQGALLYAPEGTLNVSETYFDDEAALYRPNIQTFAGPAVRRPVIGRTWGLWANTSCQPVAMDRLQFIRTNSHKNASINLCETSNLDSCDFDWTNTSTAAQYNGMVPISIPLWLNDIYSSTTQADLINYTIIAATDGFTGVGSQASYRGPWSSSVGSPYHAQYNHDNFTFDHFRGEPRNQTTSAIFEMYIWQSRQVEDASMDNLIANYSDLVQVVYEPDEAIDADFHLGTRRWAGFGVQCDITSDVGFANVNPLTHWFSDFVRHPAVLHKVASQTSLLSRDVLPLQVQAMQAFSDSNDQYLMDNKMLPTAPADSPLLLWNAFHESLRSQKFVIEQYPNNTFATAQVYPLITPVDLQRSIYKLLGESVIAMMDEITTDPWYMQLNGLDFAPYIVAGPFPWQYSVALLAVWAAITSFGALWMILSQRTRWAPTLSGFEMFKFGAQYTDELNELMHADFNHCSAPLDRIPGMIGLLPGKESGQNAGGGSGPEPTPRLSYRDRSYFVGLSENAVGPALQNAQTRFTFNRRIAATSRW